MLEKQTKEIDGHTYTFQPLMATPARKIFDELVQRFGGPLGKALEALGGAEGLSLDTDTSNTVTMLSQMAGPAGAAIAGLTAQLDAEFHKKLVGTFSGMTTVDVQDPSGEVRTPQLSKIIETHFATNLMSEAKWLAFCLEVQYGDFLEWLRGAATNTMAVQAAANASRSISRKG